MLQFQDSHLLSMRTVGEFTPRYVVHVQYVTICPLLFRWYIPNYDVADPFRWGMNQGCDFVDGGCLNE